MKTLKEVIQYLTYESPIEDIYPITFIDLRNYQIHSISIKDKDRYITTVPLIKKLENVNLPSDALIRSIEISEKGGVTINYLLNNKLESMIIIPSMESADNWGATCAIIVWLIIILLAILVNIMRIL